MKKSALILSILMLGLNTWSQIIDMMGRKLLTTGKNEIDVSIIKRGTYILRFKDSQGNIIKDEKLIKE